MSTTWSRSGTPRRGAADDQDELELGTLSRKLPVTLRFASEVGIILRDLRDDYAPGARYVFYM